MATVIGKKESECQISIGALGKVIKIDNSNSDRAHIVCINNKILCNIK